MPNGARRSPRTWRRVAAGLGAAVTLVAAAALIAGTAATRCAIVSLFARAPEPKTFWAVPGAGHQDLHAYRPAAYEHRVLSLFAATLVR